MDAVLAEALAGQPSLASTFATAGFTRARLSRTPALSVKSRISASVAAPWESTKSTLSMSRSTACSGGSASCTSARMRSSSASAVAKNRPPSSRTMASPGNVSSPPSRKTLVPGSRPSNGISGVVAT